MRPRNNCGCVNIVPFESLHSRSKKFRCLKCNAILYFGKPRVGGSKYDYPDRGLSMYTCAFTEKREVGTLLDGTPIIKRVRVCNEPGEFLCPRKKGHAYCDVHFNPKKSEQDMSRKKLEKERDEQGRRDAEAFDAEAKKLREQLSGTDEDRNRAGLFKKETEVKVNFASGIVLF